MLLPPRRRFFLHPPLSFWRRRPNFDLRTKYTCTTLHVEYAFVLLHNEEMS